MTVAWIDSARLTQEQRQEVFDYTYIQCVWIEMPAQLDTCHLFMLSCRPLPLTCRLPCGRALRK
jgi:hypothetical protein